MLLTPARLLLVSIRASLSVRVSYGDEIVNKIIHHFVWKHVDSSGDQALKGLVGF